ncbi:hypothetical protein H000_04637 [Escherichia coli UMEA 3899-1]|nr:hypothetical protein H000_04637 [Escherichia coli UMEA 3899-1]
MTTLTDKELIKEIKERIGSLEPPRVSWRVFYL